MVVGMAYVSPSRVLRASTPFVRWQVWATTVLCIGAASTTLMARTESGDSPLAAWWTLIPMALSIAAILVNAGMLWQQLNETKRRVELLEQSVPNTYARRDVIVEQFNVLRSEIAAVRELLEDR
jgi:hypothetical protein